MRVKWYELALWSFLMASAHGAGLMLFPILMDMPGGAAMHHQIMHGAHGRSMHQSMAAMGSLSLAQDVAVVLLHTAAMLLVMGTIAVVCTTAWDWHSCGALGSTSTLSGRAR